MSDKKVTRRAFVQGVALSGAALAAGIIPIKVVGADAKVDKETMKYQDSPKDGQQCDQCVYFKAPSECGIVKGDVKATGWCIGFNPIKKP